MLLGFLAYFFHPGLTCRNADNITKLKLIFKLDRNDIIACRIKLIIFYMNISMTKNLEIISSGN